MTNKRILPTPHVVPPQLTFAISCLVCAANRLARCSYRRRHICPSSTMAGGGSGETVTSVPVSFVGCFTWTAAGAVAGAAGVAAGAAGGAAVGVAAVVAESSSRPSGAAFIGRGLFRSFSSSSSSFFCWRLDDSLASVKSCRRAATLSRSSPAWVFISQRQKGRWSGGKNNEWCAGVETGKYLYASSDL